MHERIRLFGDIEDKLWRKVFMSVLQEHISGRRSAMRPEEVAATDADSAVEVYRARSGNLVGSRWAPIVATSPSGKTQFVCLVCGRISQAPDKQCSGTVLRCKDPDSRITCESVASQGGLPPAMQYQPVFTEAVRKW
jgi:hypothetical protein